MDIIFEARHPHEFNINGAPVTVSLVGTNLSPDEIALAKSLGLSVTEYRSPTAFSIDLVSSRNENRIRNLLLVEDPVIAAKMYDERDNLLTSTDEHPDGAHAITVDGVLPLRTFSTQSAAAVAAGQLFRQGVSAIVVEVASVDGQAHVVTTKGGVQRGGVRHDFVLRESADAKAATLTGAVVESTEQPAMIPVPGQPANTPKHRLQMMRVHRVRGISEILLRADVTDADALSEESPPAVPTAVSP